jgi:hypothetical protein
MKNVKRKEKKLLPLGFELTIICLKTFHAQSQRGGKFEIHVIPSNCVKRKKMLYHIRFHEEVSCRRFQYSSSKLFEIWEKSQIFFAIPLAH